MPTRSLFQPAQGTLVAFLLLAFALPAVAQHFDPSFGSDGLVVIDPGEADTSFYSVEAPAFDDNGDILVLLTGNRDLAIGGATVTALGRLDDSGAVVGSFANAGFRLLSAGEPYAHQVERRDDGRIWVVTVEWLDLGGGGAFYVVLYRFSDDGNSDNSFDFDGRRVLFGGGPTTIALAASGGIFVVRALDTDGEPAPLIKLTSSGAPDTSFAGGELSLILPPGSGSSVPLGGRAIELDDGSLLVLGRAVDPFGQPESTKCVLWRFTAAGLPFNGFGVDGTVVFEMIPGVAHSQCEYLALDGEAVIVAGQTHENDLDLASANGALARLMLSDGSLDPGFGTDGRVSTPLDPTAADHVSGLAVDTRARRILVAHRANTQADNQLGRYDADTGQPDPSLGVDGRAPLLLDFGNGPETGWLSRVAIDPEGRTLVTGANFGGGSAYPWVVRLAGAEVFADSFED